MKLPRALPAACVPACRAACPDPNETLPTG